MKLNSLFTNPGLLRSPLDDGSYQIPESSVREVFGAAGIPFSSAGTRVYVNINGNVSFGEAVHAYTPSAIPGLRTPAVAAYFADIDLRDHVRLLRPNIDNPGSVYLCVESDGNASTVTPGDLIMVTWENVVRYNAADGFNASQTSSFQVILSVPAESCGTAPETRGVDVEFRYARLSWTTGDASGGSGGFGGTPATAGVDNGRGAAIALPGSGTASVVNLTTRTNVGEPGVFRVRSWGGALSDCGNGSIDACEVCDGSSLAPGATCPAGYTGTPLCNNHPSNPAGDGTCTLAPVPYGCVDVDECAPGGGAACGEGTLCVNTDGGYRCECAEGSTGDGSTCYDLVIVSPRNGDTITDATPTIVGAAEPGAEIIVSVDGMEVGRTVVDADGTFVFTPSLALGEGAHTITVTAVGSSGSSATESVDVMVDLSTIAFITAPTEGAILGDTTPRIAGRAEPGASVVIRVDGVEVATVVTSRTGDWSHTLTTPLADGDHTVEITATDAAGNEATDSVRFGIDSSLPALDIIAPPHRGYTNESTPTITGTADPGATIDVTIDGVMAGTAIANGAGDWALATTTVLEDGEHSVIATTQNAGGFSSSDQHDFTVDTVPPALVVTSPEAGQTVGSRPTFAGTGEPGTSVEVVVDGVVVGSVVVGADGTWSVTPSTPLEDGDHHLVATAVDGAGNTTTVERDFGSSGSVVSPIPVKILSPRAGSVVGVDPPTIAGTAAPGASIENVIDGVRVATVTADIEGNWSYTHPVALGQGEHQLVVSATSPSGHRSSDSVRFAIDTTGTHEDTDGDGVPDSVECPMEPCRDTDGDGTPDYADADDDGDGIPTVIERPDGTDRDTDGDGVPDHLDPDDDGDGIPTREEAPGGAARDTGGDGLPDHRDADDDGDGIPTRIEREDGEIHGNDPDEDGIPNWLDTDSDGDGIPDAEEGRGDSDGDGIPNYLDPTDGEGPLPPPGGGLTGGAGCSVGGRSQPMAWLFVGLAGLALLARRRQSRGGAR